mgnify:CR=1 FL=1
MSSKELLKLLKENDNLYCHVSGDLTKDNYFYPRLPAYTRNDEEYDTPRVCVSKTLEGALSALPKSFLNEKPVYGCNSCNTYYKVFIVDVDKLGIKEMLHSDYLYEKDYVRDASITGEVWILEPFTVPDEYTFYIKVDSWTEGVDDIIPHHIYELAETEQYEGDYCAAYEDYYDENMPSMLVIENLTLTLMDVKKGDRLEIDLSFAKSSLDKDELKKMFLKTNPNISFLDEDYEKDIVICIDESQNISEIIYTDWYYKYHDGYKKEEKLISDMFYGGLYAEWFDEDYDI